jgi:pantothenate kinase
VARCVGLDGWHISRAELAMFPDPEEAFARRVGLSLRFLDAPDRQGAPFTYDLDEYSRFVKSAKYDSSSLLGFPTFEHHIKDPVPSAIPLLPSNRIVIIEGLYTILDEPGWTEVSDHIDFSIYVDTPRIVARERCIKRNFAAGLAETLEATAYRGTGLTSVP